MHDYFFYCELCSTIQAPDNWEGSYNPSAQPLALCKKLKLVEVHYADELDRRVHYVIRILKSHSNFEVVNGEETF